MCFDWFFINFIECEFSIVLILNCIAFMRFLNRVLLLKSSCDFLTRIFCYVFVEIVVRSSYWLCCSYSDSWWFAERIERSRSLFSMLRCRKFILHECFDKMRRLFLLRWRFWSAVTAMSSQELEMIDARRWRQKQNRIVEITCVDLSLYEDDLLLKFCFETCDFSNSCSLTKLKNRW